MDGERGGQTLGKAGAKHVSCQAGAGRIGVRLGRPIEGHQVEVRLRAHLARAALAERDHRDVARNGAEGPLALDQRCRGQTPDHRIGKVGEGGAGRLWVGLPLQHLNGDAEGVFAAASARQVHGRL